MNLLEILIKKKLLNEGVYDPAILKCIFFAGGPGSGKTYVANELFNVPSDLPLSSYGLKVINSDREFEYLLKKNNITTNLASLSEEDFRRVTSGNDSIRYKAKLLNKKKLDLYRSGRLGLIIDSTGDEINSIQMKKRVMESYGYDCFMIFVNTEYEVALARNNKRSRKLPEELVKQIWGLCQRNIGHFQNIFGNNFRVVDNSGKGGIDKSVIRSVVQFLSNPIENKIGKKWVSDYFTNKKKVEIFSKIGDSKSETVDDYEDDFYKKDVKRYTGKKSDDEKSK